MKNQRHRPAPIGLIEAHRPNQRRAAERERPHQCLGQRRAPVRFHVHHLVIYRRVGSGNPDQPVICVSRDSRAQQDVFLLGAGQRDPQRVIIEIAHAFGDCHEVHRGDVIEKPEKCLGGINAAGQGDGVRVCSVGFVHCVSTRSKAKSERLKAKG